MKHYRGIILFLSHILFSSIASFGQGGMAFTNINLVPMTEDELILEDHYLLVRDGKIMSIGEMSDFEVMDDMTIFDGEGGYVIPGLTEMHAHIPSKNNGDELIKETLFLYLSNGITTIRGMLGESYHLQLREQVATGKVNGPRIFTSGPSLNGNSVRSVEQAETTVKAQKEAGYDFLKLHPGLTREVFDQIVSTAKEVDIDYAGHVSLDVGIRHALESEYASVDHVDGYVEGLVPESAGVSPEENGFFGINFTDLADESMIPELVELTRENEVWVVPTQSLMIRWAGPESPQSLGSQDEMKYMRGSTVDRWIQVKESFISGNTYDKERAERFISLRAKIIKALHDGGVELLLGSDAPQIFNVPGFSIRHEMRSMVKAGLTPYETIEIGTANPAKYFSTEGEFGTLVEGASADFILTESNPVQDIENVFNQKGVMVRGQWLSSDEIEEKLKNIETKYAR